MLCPIRVHNAESEMPIYKSAEKTTSVPCH